MAATLGVRDRILEAAYDLFSNHGLQAVGHALSRVVVMEHQHADASVVGLRRHGMEQRGIEASARAEVGNFDVTGSLAWTEAEARGSGQAAALDDGIGEVGGAEHDPGDQIALVPDIVQDGRECSDPVVESSGTEG